MDREKLIKHFEHLLNAAKGNYQDFVDLTVDAGEEILELLKDQDELGTELTNAMELIHKKNERIKKLLKEQETKTGHWIDTTNTIGFPQCECSECNSEAGAIWMKYCPNCGAKMEGR